MKKRILSHVLSIVWVCVLFVSMGFLSADVVGSWTNVSRDTDIYFPVTDDLNIIQGFSFVNGFSLQSGGVTTATFNSRMPVRGGVWLNDGTLSLEQDLIFRNNAQLENGGTIIGNGHIVEFSQSMDELQLTERIGSDILNIAQAPASNGEHVNIANWSHDDLYVASGTDGQVGVYEMFVYRVDDDDLVDTGAEGPSTYHHPFFWDDRLLDVRWHPSEYFIAVGTSEEGGGFSTYDYEFRVFEFVPGTSTLYARYKEDFSDTYDVRAVAWHPGGSWLAVGTQNPSHGIRLYNFNTTTKAMDGSTPRQSFALPENQAVGRTCVDWDPEGNYIAAGLSQHASGDELVIYHFNGTTFNTTPTVSINIGETVRSLDWHPTDSLIVVGLSSGTERLRLYELDQDTWTLQEKTSARIGEPGTVFSVHWKPDGKKIIMTRDTDGAFDPDDPLTTELRAYDFNSATNVFSFIHGLNSSFDLNSARWAHSGDRIVVATDKSGRRSYTIIYDLLQGALFSRDLRLFLNNDLTLRTPISLTGDNLINARGNKVIITDNATINLKGNTTLTFENSRIVFDKPGVFSLEDVSSKIIFKNSTIELNNDAFIAQGSLEFDGEVTIDGPYTFAYQSLYTSTIRAHSTLRLIDDATLSIGRLPDHDQQPIIFTDHTSSLVLNNASLSITDSGWQVTKGNIDIHGKSVVSIEYSDTQYGLILGDGTMDNDVTLTIRGGSELQIRNGSLVLDPYQFDGLLFFGNDAQLSLYDSGRLFVRNPLAFTNGSIYLPDGAAIEKEDDVYITANQTRIHDRYQDFYLTGTIVSATGVVLDQNDELILNSGNLSKTITVSRDNNTLYGDGTISGNIVLLDQNSSLTWSIDAKVDEYSIVLNGGKLILGRDIDFYQDLSAFAVGDDVTISGTIDLDNHVMGISANDSVWTGSFYLTGNGARIAANAKMSLSGSWTIDGSVTIDGNGQILELGPMAYLYVTDGSTLTLRNMVLKDLSGTKLQALGDASRIIFDDTLIFQDGDYEFETGALTFRNEVDLIGGDGCQADTIYSFSYKSDQPSTIDANSFFHAMRGIRLEFGNDDKDASSQALEFTDRTSVLHLDESILRIVDQGMKLLCGRIRVSNHSILEVDTTYGVTLGDGASADNDSIIQIEGDAKLSINDGILFYNNVASADRIIFIDDPATIRVNYNGGFTAHRTVYLEHGTLSFPTQDYLATIGSAVIDQDHMRHVHDYPYSSHVVQGQFQTGLGYLLIDDGFFVSESGRSTVPMVFDSGVSTFGGMGIVQATLTLQNAGSTLVMGLESDLNGNIVMNGGTLNLATHLTFVGDKAPLGSGTIALNDNTFSFGSDEQTLSHEILWDMSSSVNLQAKTSLSGTWTFKGTGKLNGHGHILDLSNGGRIFVDVGATLYLSDIIIKGVADSGFGELLFGDRDSQIRMSNVSVVLSNDYTVTTGGIYVEGPTIWYMDNHDWAFEQNASLTVDGMTLWKDSLDKAVPGDILFDSPEYEHFTLLASGTIKEAANAAWIRSDTTLLGNADFINEGDVNQLYEFFTTIDHGPTNIFYDTNQTMSYNIYLGPHHTMAIDDDLTLNGSTYYIHFSRSTQPLLTIAAGKTLTLEDIVLKDFTPDYLSFGDADSALVFGDNVTIELMDDVTLSTPWLFTGNARLRGFESKITLVDGGMLDVAGSNSLILEDLTISGLGVVSDGLRCRTNDGLIVVKDSELALAHDYTFSYGSMIFEHDAKITGTKTFVYATSMTSTIAAESKLLIDLNTTFSYDPPVANRDLLVMTNTTSRLHLDGAVLYSTSTGLRLNDGTVLLDNLVTISAEGLVASEAITFGSVTDGVVNLVLEVLGGADVETYGYVEI